VPPRTDRRALEEGLDVLADALIVVVVGEHEAGTTRGSGGGAMRRRCAVGEISHGPQV
jgi:hypothetical protein